jgi:hypothetical protein
VAKTLDNLVDEIRLMTKDRRVPYRYTQTDILEAINSAFRETKRLRPDIFVGCCTDEAGGTIDLPSYVEADLGLTPTPTPYLIDEIFFMTTVFYAVGKLQLGDDEFTLDNRAMTLLAAFRQALVGG